MSRLAVCATLFVASCLLVSSRGDFAAAQDKKDKDKDTKKEAALEKQVAALKQDLQQAEKLNAALKQEVVQHERQVVILKQEVATLRALLKKEGIEDKKDDKTIRGLQAVVDGYRNAGLVHVVVLKLKTDSPSGEPQSVIDEVYSQLSKIKTVRGVWAGKPASKGTPDAETDYTVALVFVFDDQAGLKAYLDDPVHTKFADKHLKLWEKPVVYDFEPKKPTAP
ncbi:MAG: Dabb family protein [Gemmataceae bacterium]|nr:Dabb family protein [Gemmataceae bacterium]